MFKSFGVKLGLAITILTVGLTTISVSYCYAFASMLVRRQTTAQLIDIGSVGTFLFTEEDRKSIARLKAKIDQDSQPSLSDVENLADGDVLSSLTSQQIDFYHSTAESQRIVQILRKIQYSSQDQIEPLQSHYPQSFLNRPDSVFTFLLTTTPESPNRRVLKFIASSIPEPEGNEWPGNPVGNLYVPIQPVFRDAFDGEIQIADGYYSDGFYSAITVAVPIKDEQGKTIAVLGLDFLAGSEQDQLRRLGSVFIIIVVISFALSVLLSLLIAQCLSHPIRQLQIAAQSVQNQDYAVVLDTSRQDELGVLARIFNAMSADVQQYAIKLKTKNQQLKKHSHDLEKVVQERTLALHQANSRLQRLATLDGLTNIFNRRYFDEHLQQEWQRALCTCSGLSLILCDVDFFKAYNDTYGHPAGDECLQIIAGTIKHCIRRSGDFVARYGGEEFAIVLTNTTLDEATHIAEKIRTRVNALKLEHSTSHISDFITISMGIANATPKKGQLPISLVEQADKGLYQSKQNGRDTISKVK